MPHTIYGVVRDVKPGYKGSAPVGRTEVNVFENREPAEIYRDRCIAAQTEYGKTFVTYSVEEYEEEGDARRPPSERMQYEERRKAERAAEDARRKGLTIPSLDRGAA